MLSVFASLFGVCMLCVALTLLLQMAHEHEDGQMSVEAQHMHPRGTSAAPQVVIRASLKVLRLHDTLYQTRLFSKLDEH